MPLFSRGLLLLPSWCLEAGLCFCSHIYVVSSAPFQNINFLNLIIYSLVLFLPSLKSINIKISVLFLCYSGRNFSGFVEASLHGFKLYNDLLSRTGKWSLTYEWCTLHIIFEITKCVLLNFIYFSMNILLLIHLLCELRAEYCILQNLNAVKQNRMWQINQVN